MKRIALIFTLTTSVFLVSCAEKSPQKFDPPPEVEESTTRPITAEKWNLNTATAEEFKTVPEVGDRMAHEFDEYRPYISIVQFRREIGKYVDEEQVSMFEDYVYVPIDINESDAKTVAQILGLDLEGAQQLVAARPFESHDAFYAAVTEVAGGIAAQFARLYVSE